MPDELEEPSQKKETEGVGPQPMHKDGTDEKRRCAMRIVGMPRVWQARFTGWLMAGGVLGDPLLTGAVA